MRRTTYFVVSLYLPLIVPPVLFVVRYGIARLEAHGQPVDLYGDAIAALFGRWLVGALPYCLLILLGRFVWVGGAGPRAKSFAVFSPLLYVSILLGLFLLSSWYIGVSSWAGVPRVLAVVLVAAYAHIAVVVAIYTALKRRNAIHSS